MYTHLPESVRPTIITYNVQPLPKSVPPTITTYNVSPLPKSVPPTITTYETISTYNARPLPKIEPPTITTNETNTYLVLQMNICWIGWWHLGGNLCDSFAKCDFKKLLTSKAFVPVNIYTYWVAAEPVYIIITRR